MGKREDTTDMDARFLTTGFYRRPGDQETRRTEFLKKSLLISWSPGLL
jgi:hypothetical protein